MCGRAEAFANGTFTTGFYQEAIQKYCDAQPTHHYFINQLANEANPGVHYATTGPEIWEDTDGKVDILVATSGTAGTITDLLNISAKKIRMLKLLPYRQIRPQDLVVPKIRRPLTALRHLAIRFPDAAKAPFIVGFDYDEYIDVKGEDAYALGREIAQTDGVFLGQSAGAALHAATIVAQRPENAGKNIVVILADNGMKYLSTNMYPLDKKVQ